MNFPHRSIRPVTRLAACCCLSTLSPAAEKPAPAAAAVPADIALPAGNGRLAAHITDSPGQTTVNAALLPKLADKDRFAIFRNAAESARFWQKAFADPTQQQPVPPLPEPRARLEVDWIFGDEPPASHTRNVPTADGRLISTHRLGRTTIRRTILVSRAGDAIFIHVHADQPGAVSLRARLVPPHPQTVEIEDRRQLVSSGENTLRAHAWILPFESDVETGEENTILIRGEGEALIIFNLGSANEPDPHLASTLKRLGQAYDPGHTPPNPSRIWQGILAAETAPIPAPAPEAPPAENYH